MILRDDYPGQEKLLLWLTRIALCGLVGVVLGAVLMEGAFDPFAISTAAVAALGVYELRSF
jgi:hypothetical protein